MEVRTKGKGTEERREGREGRGRVKDLGEEARMRTVFQAPLLRQRRILLHPLTQKLREARRKGYSKSF